ncbi:nucleotidyltransferase family protein [Argonema antarcticum]|uniref:nucleotidyltransferase family protein n=1 Tax=Argonema antarcticum TaxID=2942763 RepID=UPI00201127F2|nr:nucleotidyltransferase family protein [Argonema antarcticum]MCL1471457.1 nucleotidyltransferase family protein [Argonema antarcticum A004/B2]
MNTDFHSPPLLFAIVLSAGASRRMGTCKASLPWEKGKTLLSYQVEQFLLAGITPVVVLGPHNCDRKKDCPPDTCFVINPDPSQGKTSSILTGLQSIPKNCQVLAISAVDQPRPTEIYQKLLQEQIHNDSIITAPTYKGKLGHPLFFSSKALLHLENIREETFGLRQVVQEFYAVINKVEFDNQVVITDINTPENYSNVLSAE